MNISRQLVERTKPKIFQRNYFKIHGAALAFIGTTLGVGLIKEVMMVEVKGMTATGI